MKTKTADPDDFEAVYLGKRGARGAWKFSFVHPTLLRNTYKIIRLTNEEQAVSAFKKYRASMGRALVDPVRALSMTDLKKSLSRLSDAVEILSSLECSGRVRRASAKVQEAVTLLEVAL